jgi:hypothetical protein
MMEQWEKKRRNNGERKDMEYWNSGMLAKEIDKEERWLA